MKVFASRRLVLGLVALGIAAMLLPACTHESAPTDNTAMLPDEERVSTVPWNKPQGWENRGQLGALANDPRIGGAQ